MRRGAAAIGLVVLALTVSGCTDPFSQTLPELTRDRVAGDEIPASAQHDGIDLGTSRFVGTDSVGTAYYLSWATGERTVCVTVVPADDRNVVSGCGGGTLTRPDGSEVHVLSREDTGLQDLDGERVGESLLVTLPG